MDIHDLMNHPFKIECPAELVGELPDCWLFQFDNGYEVHVGQDDGMLGFWHVTVTDPEGNASQAPWLTDDNSAISDLIDHVAHLEKP